MRQRGYTLAFVVVLLLACIGGFFGGRLVLQQMQRDFGRGPSWTPPAGTSTGIQQATLPAAPTAAPLATPTSLRRPTATVLVVATPVGVPPVPVETSTPGPVTVAPGDTATPAPGAAETASPTPEPTLAPVFPYALSRQVRHTTGDCPGNYVLGQVTDRSGSPLPNVRLRLTDEYGTAPASAVSKAGQSDLGRYDFPLYGPPRRYFITVVDAAGQPLSAEVEIRHGLAPNADATCHWVDWRRQ